MRTANELMLTIVLGGLGVYFSVLNGRGLLRYAQFRRVQRTAVLTWPLPHPRHYALQIVLGVVSGGVAVLNGAMDRPIHHDFSQAVMSFSASLTFLPAHGVTSAVNFPCGSTVWRCGRSSFRPSW